MALDERALEDAMNRMIQAANASGDAFERMAAAQVAMSNAMGGNSKKALDDFYKGIQGSSKALQEQRNRARSEEEHAKKAKEAQDNLVSSLKNGLKGLQNFAGAANSTEQSFSKYNQGMRSMGDAAFEIGKQFGPLGTAIGATVKAFTLAAERVNELNDTLLKSYDDFGKLGATAGLTTKNILDLGRDAGYSSKNLGTFTKQAAGLGEALINLGGSSSEGVKAFSQIAKIGDNARKEFSRMGISQAEVTEMQANYIKQVASAGGSLRKPINELQKESLGYITNLQKLAELTGVDIKKMEEAQKAAMQQENFNAYIMKKEAERDQLRAQAAQAEKEGDTERAKALKAQADQTDQVIKTKKEFAGLAQATMSQKNASAALEAISTDNASTFTESNAQLLRAGIDISKMNQEMNKGNDQTIELQKSQAKAVEDYNKKFGEAGYAYGGASRKLQETMGVDNKMREQAGKNSRLLTEEGYQQAKKDKALKDKEYDEKAKNLQKEKDAATEARAAQEIAEKDFQQAQDRLTDLVRGPITQVFSFFQTKLLEVATGLIDMVSFVIEKFGDVKNLISSLWDGLSSIVSKVGKFLGISSEAASPPKPPEAKAAETGSKTAATKAEPNTPTAKPAGTPDTTSKAYADASKKLEQTRSPGTVVAQQAPQAAPQAGSPQTAPQTTTATATSRQTPPTARRVDRSESSDILGIDALDKFGNTLESLNKTLNVTKTSFASVNENLKQLIDNQKEEIEKQEDAASGAGGTGTAYGKSMPQIGRPAMPSMPVITRQRTMPGGVAAGGAGGMGTPQVGGRPPAGGGMGAPAMPSMGGMTTKGDSPDISKEASATGAQAPKAKPSQGGGGDLGEAEIKKMIMQHEGVRTKPYKDTKGLWTVGVGHLIGDGKTLPDAWNREFSMDEVMAIFDEDYKHHRQAAESIPGFNKLGSGGQGALTDLTFNMGPSWYKKWPTFQKQLSSGDIEGAASNLEGSAWYKQVGRRAPTVVSLLRNTKVSAAEGGLASGPIEGYPATLHGEEAIIPFDPNSILSELMKAPASDFKTPNQNITSTTTQSNDVTLSLEMLDVIADKLDTMIEKMSESNNTQGQLLKYSRV